MGLMLLLLSSAGVAGLCSEVGSLNRFNNLDRITSDFFDEYFIRKSNGRYFVYADKMASVDFASATKVMNHLESHPSFIPGYQSIKVLRGPDREILTGIRFRAAFSPFSSSFTNQVEIIDEQDRYKQCWEQLAAEDMRVIEDQKNAPKVNVGYWWLDKISESSVEIRYFSVVQPPLAIPAWLYTRIVKGSYEELFDRIIKRIKQVGGDALPDQQAAEPDIQDYIMN